EACPSQVAGGLDDWRVRLGLMGAIDAIGGVRQGVEPAAGDLLAAALAAAEGAVANALPRGVDVRQRGALHLEQAEVGFLLELVGAEVGGVQRGVGQAAAGLAPPAAPR